MEQSKIIDTLETYQCTLVTLVTHYELLDACEPCLMSKMIKTPFSGTMEQATDLLEIIYTDVCGPMSVEA